MALQAVIFDVDGTLADTERDGHRPAFNAAFAAAGLDWHWSEQLYGGLLEVAGGKERIRHYAEQYDRETARRPDFPDLVAALHRSKTSAYARLVAAGSVSLRPGVLRLLQELRSERVRLAIATTTTPDNVDALLTPALGSGWRAWFEAVGAGDLVPAKKPAPDIYHWVLDRLGLGGGDCLALEDSANGLQASLAADIPTLVTVSDYTEEQDFGGALAVVSDLGEPHRAMRVIRGACGGQPMVDVRLLRTLHAHAGLRASAR